MIHRENVSEFNINIYAEPRSMCLSTGEPTTPTSEKLCIEKLKRLESKPQISKC